MKNLDERFLVYTALLVPSCVAGVFTGPVAATGSFLQIALVIEVIYRFGKGLIGSGRGAAGRHDEEE